ncbi:MAG: hypothetical protein A2521_03420 [Deltaproteobacteria bacterium RIFOXYD12_FULL_57_12]|nr:MAG: hypothetical protein A2521_03420 [Deltaproteobacteria bacterium RIFOXYD12_FULL_57_12]
MARIAKVKRKRGIAYKAEVRLKGHPYVSQTFDRLSDAQRWAEDTEKALRSGGYVGDTPLGDLRFTAALDRYLLEISSRKRPNTKAREETSGCRLLEGFRGVTLREITPARVASYRDKRLKDIGPSTIQKELALLSHLYPIARTEWNLDVANPVASIRKPSQPNGRLRFLTRDEARHLLDVCKTSRNPKLHIFVQLLLHTGMRPSEGAGLRWSQIDVDARIVDLTITKTKPRRVPLTVAAVEIILEIMPERCMQDRPVFLPEKISSTIKRRPNLFFRRAFDNAVKKAGIDDFHMHDLRHTAASHLLMSGADLRTLAEILGHSTMQMVQRYTHLLDDHKLKAIDRIEHLGG